MTHLLKFLISIGGAFALLTASCVAGQDMPRVKTDMKNPVILVHGIIDDERRMGPMARYLRRQGRTVYTVSLKPSWGQLGLDELAKQLEGFIREKIPAGEKFDLVGFSMGGLICRYYAQRLGGLSHIDHFITLASPHHGTWMAYAGWNTGCTQMRPDSAFLRDLNHDISTLNRVKFTSIWTPLDLMIVPASSSHTGLGREIKIWMPAHPLMALHPICIRAVASELQR